MNPRVAKPVCLLLLAGALARAEADRITVRPADTGAALVNPGMGWTFHDVRELGIAPLGQPPERLLQSTFTVARRLPDPLATHAPSTRPGACDVFVSVGRRDGTPGLELPLANGDGQRRYRVGTLRLVEAR